MRLASADATRTQRRVATVQCCQAVYSCHRMRLAPMDATRTRGDQRPRFHYTTSIFECDSHPNLAVSDLKGDQTLSLSSLAPFSQISFLRLRTTISTLRLRVSEFLKFDSSLVWTDLTILRDREELKMKDL